MAVRKKKRQTGKVEYEKIVWVIDNLTTEQLEMHDKSPLNAEAVLKNVLLMVDAGFRVTCKYDSYSKSYMASATCSELGLDNSGLAIAARGSDIQDCLSIVVFKYVKVANSDLRGFTDIIPVGVRG